MNWVLVYNLERHAVAVDSNSREVEEDSFTYADEDDPWVQDLLLDGILIEVPIYWNPSIATGINEDALMASVEVIFRNGGGWVPPPDPPVIPTPEELAGILADFEERITNVEGATGIDMSAITDRLDDLETGAAALETSLGSIGAEVDVLQAIVGSGGRLSQENVETRNPAMSNFVYSGDDLTQWDVDGVHFVATYELDPDGVSRIHTLTVNGVTRTFAYNGSGQLTGVS